MTKRRTTRDVARAHACLLSGALGVAAAVAACSGASDTTTSAGPETIAPPSLARDASSGATDPPPREAGPAPARDASPWLDGSSGTSADGGPSPQRVFIDTDLVWDSGDIGAMTLAHALADRCEIRIIGVSVVSTSPWAASTADAINTYYGRSDIPVGVLEDGPFLESQGGFGQSISTAFPNRFPQVTAPPDATTVFRAALAAQPDHSVTLVSIGPFRNLRHFLESPPDATSPMTGRDLIAAKVSLLSSMAGVFADIGAFGGPVTSEFNVNQDADAASYVVQHWPTPIMFSGFEIGWYMCTDAGIAQTDPASPLASVLVTDSTPCGDGKGRPAWDQTSLLYAARGLGSFWTGKTTGSVSIQVPGGQDAWSATPELHQGFLVNVGVDITKDEATVRADMAMSPLNKAMVDLENGAGKVGACVARK